MTSYYPTAVKPLERHRILITFDNNEQRIFDITPYWMTVFPPLVEKLHTVIYNKKGVTA